MTSITAIVTGHTRGLGAALADDLLARGIDVLGIARSRRPDAPGMQQVELDLAEPHALEAWIATDALAQFMHGAHTILLINNAGLLQPVGPIASQSPGAIARAVSVNVAAPLMLSAAVAAASAHVTDRRIVHISSGAGRNAYAGWSLYCATKAALDHHARAVSLDDNHALRMASVAPGVIDTDMQAEIRGTRLEQFPMREKFDELKRQGQLSTPADAARKVLDYALGDSFGDSPVVDIRDIRDMA
jgi:benzil reductase ((S)-benzoin forming)